MIPKRLIDISKIKKKYKFSVTTPIRQGLKNTVNCYKKIIIYDITRTPFRISLFGGGTDYPEWFSKNKGQVISLAIK